MRSFKRSLNALAALGLALCLVSAATGEASGQTPRKTQRRAGSQTQRKSTTPAAPAQPNNAVFIGGGAATGAVRQNPGGTPPAGNNGVVASGAALGAGVGGVRQPSSPATPTVGVADIGPKWDPLESTCRHASLSIL